MVTKTEPKEFVTPRVKSVKLSAADVVALRRLFEPDRRDAALSRITGAITDWAHRIWMVPQTPSAPHVIAELEPLQKAAAKMVETLDNALTPEALTVLADITVVPAPQSAARRSELKWSSTPITANFLADLGTRCAMLAGHCASSISALQQSPAKGTGGDLRRNRKALRERAMRELDHIYRDAGGVAPKGSPTEPKGHEGAPQVDGEDYAQAEDEDYRCFMKICARYLPPE